MDRGGAEMRTLDVMRTTDPGAFSLDFCALSGLAGALDPEISALGGRTHLCKLDILFPVRFVRLLRKERYDVVHSHVLLVSGFILLLSYLAGVPGRIAHFRSTGNGAPIGRVRRLRDRMLRFMIDKSATDILAVSNGAMKAVWTNFKPEDGRCQVVYSGVDIRPYEDRSKRESAREALGIAGECTVFIHVGRFNEAKNHERLIDIFSKVRESLPTSVLLMVGGGPVDRESALRAKVHELRMSDCVQFLGLRDDVPTLLMAADAMIFPSRWEGLPGVVLEACAAGLPVVATDLPGICEIAGHLSGVVTLRLDQDDSVWAKHAVSLASGGRNESSTGSMLSGSPFDLRINRETLETIWKSAVS
jgi:glycosyltransferase involved in cell wall biosynthesis